VYEARRPSALTASRWAVTRDGVPLTEIRGSVWGRRGQVTLAGRDYTIRTSWTGTRYELRPAGGAGSSSEDVPIARAERVGRKEWTISADDTVHRFRRASWWRGDQDLVVGGHVLGSIRRAGGWRGGAVADLPGLPEVVGVFALTRRSAARVTAAVAVAGLGSATVVWGETARRRVEFAERDVRGLVSADAETDRLLGRLGAALADSAAFCTR
jgi:hypothetical protein